MIPAAFDYHRPADLAGAVRLLAEHGDEALVVAGGHSLIPMMKLRMAQPGHLVESPRDRVPARGARRGRYGHHRRDDHPRPR